MVGEACFCEGRGSPHPRVCQLQVVACPDHPQGINTEILIEDAEATEKLRASPCLRALRVEILLDLRRGWSAPRLRRGMLRRPSRLRGGRSAPASAGIELGIPVEEVAPAMV